MNTTKSQAMCVAELAAEVGVSKHTIYRAIRDGHLRAYRLTPNTTRVDRVEWERFKASGGLLAAPAAP